MEQNISLTDAYSQRRRIISYMEEHGGITSYEATHKLDIMSPRKRFSEINARTPLTKTVEYHVHYIEGKKKTIRFIRYSLPTV